MRKKVTIIILIFMPFNLLFGQDYNLNYYQNELFVNPAFTGSQGQFSGTINVQRQWIDMEGSPEVQYLQVHTPAFKNKIGLGLSLRNESFGVSRIFNVGTNYAYLIKLRKGTLSLGLQMGFATAQDRNKEVGTPQVDPQFEYNTKMLMGFSTGIGAYYADSLFYVGISAPSLIDNSIISNTQMANKLDFEKMPFYITGGYLFKLNPAFYLKPSVLLGYSQYDKFGYNVNLTAFYKDKVWVGALAHYDHKFGGNVGFNLLDYVNISYTCTFSYGELYKARGTTHGLSLNVMLNFNGNKPIFKYF